MRLLAWFYLLFTPALFGQTAVSQHFVRASGEATVTAKPDRAFLDIGVVTQAATAQAASTQNAAQSTQVLNSVRPVLGIAGDVKTSGYSLTPQYEYTNGRPAKLTGYEANNTVLVTVDDLAILGKIIDAAAANGANNVTGISFTLKDDTAVRAQALKEAAVKARGNAEVLAKALNVQVIGVLEAEPNEGFVRPLIQPMRMMAKVQTTATPIESGNLDIHATVTVTLEVR